MVTLTEEHHGVQITQDELVTNLVEQARKQTGVAVLTRNYTPQELITAIQELDTEETANPVHYIKMDSEDVEYVHVLEEVLPKYKVIYIDHRGNHFFNYPVIQAMKKAKAQGIEVYKVTPQGVQQV